MKKAKRNESGETYIIRGLSKNWEQDDWKNGCLPGTEGASDIDYTFEGSTPTDVMQQVCDFVGCEIDDVEVNACDEDGRVDFAVTEDDDGRAFDKDDFKAWKRGELTAWYCIYTGYVEKIQRVRIPK